MKKIIDLSFIFIVIAILLSVVLIVVSCNSTTVDEIMPANIEGIHFQKGNIKLALEQSKAQNKPVCIFAYGNHCGYCKKMKKEVFPEKIVAETFNNNFINVQVDVDSDEGKNITDQFHIAATPTFIFMNSNGQVFKQLSGFQDKEELLAATKTIQ
ncbi:MAG: thioredoxin family protein [Ferruginibacter sp.]